MTTIRVDAHHHVWDLAAHDQPWIVGPAMEPIHRSFAVDDLAPELAARDVGGTVLVQTVASRAESLELLTIAARTPFVLGVVGHVDLAAADVDDQLDELIESPGGGCLVGIRHVVEAEPDPGWLARPDVIDGLRAVARRGLVYDLLVKPQQLAAAIEAVAAVPDARFVLDHLGKPPIAEGSREPWATQLAALARFENVSAKLSGLVTEADWSSWSTSDLAPYVDHALEIFGPHRLMFGSDWPVCLLASTYSEVVDAVDALVAQLSADESDLLFEGTATAVYGLRARQVPS